ncbi:MAG TPA: prolyl oligopeptidase family serine peptidase [Ktedonobacterales bacterium]|jgi:pimeloyl-ACP methyl ester carboxylesterase
MKLRYLLVLALLVLVGGVMTTSRVAYAAPATSSCAGDVGPAALIGTIGGANYKIEVPANWNGTLVLYSHGYVFPGPTNPAASDVGDALTGGALLSQGYALAGSSYSKQGWALEQAFTDQIALLDFFDQTCGHPTRTIAWGHSLGGIITAGLVQLFPDRFDAALPMCGVLAGGIGTWNQALDGAFAFNVLLAGNALPIVHFNPAQISANFSQAEGILATAQQTPQGRARIALLSAFGDTPGWFNSASPEPAANDFATQEANQFLWASQVDFAFVFFARAELEARAGGNPSWNTGVNYRVQFAKSANKHEVEALYNQAGLSLNHDLDALNHAPRIAADPQAVNYLNHFITFNGDLDMPVLTLHTTGDGLVVNQDEQAYKRVVDKAGDANLLRQVFVHRAGHCTFTPAETLAAFQTLINRLNTGRWDDSTDPNLLNQEAAALGQPFNIAPPAFIRFHPTLFLRPFDNPHHHGFHH